jgi:hypothetical protein
MCAQLDLEVRCKRPKKRQDHLIFIYFGVKRFIVKTPEEEKNLVFEC